MPMLSERRTAHINNFMFRSLGKPALVDCKKVKVPKCDAYKRSVEYAGSLQWNSLPIQIRNLITMKLSKRCREENCSLDNNNMPLSFRDFELLGLPKTQY